MSSRKVFVAATGQHIGKTTLSVALYHLAKQKYDKVGFIKPVGQEHLNFKGIDVDKDVAMMAQVYGIEEDLEYMSPVLAKRGFTKDVLDGKIDTEELLERIKLACKKLEEKYDFLIIEGTGHGGVGGIFDLNNAQVAAALDAPVIIITDGGIGNAYDKTALNIALYEKHKATVKMVMLNKLIAKKREQAITYITKAFNKLDITVLPGLNFNPLLANPTWTDLGKLFRQPVQGDKTHKNRIIENFILGAPSTNRVLEMLGDDSVVVLPNTRNRLLITLATCYSLPEYKNKIGGLIISGRDDNKELTQKILEQTNIPFIKVKKPIDEIFDKLQEYVSKTSAEDIEKINHIQKSFEKVLSFQDVENLL